MSIAFPLKHGFYMKTINRFVLYTDRVCARDLESMREVVECVGPGTDGVLGPRHLGEEPGAAVHAQLADVHVRLRRAHRTTLGHTLHFILQTQIIVELVTTS